MWCVRVFSWDNGDFSLECIMSLLEALGDERGLLEQWDDFQKAVDNLASIEVRRYRRV